MNRPPTRYGGIRLPWLAGAALYALLLGVVLIAQSPPVATVRGTVLAHNYRPLFGATVVARAIDGGRTFATETDRDGRFELIAEPGLLELEAEWRADRCTPATLELVEGELGELNLVMPRPSSWAGRLEIFSPERVYTTDEEPSVGIHGTVRNAVGLITVDRVDLDRMLVDNGGARWFDAWGSSIGRRGLDDLAPYLTRVSSFTIDIPAAEGDSGDFVRYLKLPPQQPGAYLINLAVDRLSQRFTFQVTDLGAVVKSDRRRLIAYVCDLRSGAPRAGVAVELWDRDGAGRQAVATTDLDGLATLLPTDPSADSHVVLARDGAHQALVLCHAGWWDDETRAIHLYTDRPIYRPGHRVWVKGIARDRTESGYAVPPPQPVTLTVRDGRGQMVSQLAGVTNEWGSFALDFAIPEEAFTGEWSLSAKVGEASAYQNLEVAAYLKPEYKVTATAPDGELTAESAAVFSVGAEYYFGSPVGFGEVSYSLRRSERWSYHYHRDHDWDDDAPWIDEFYRASQGTQEFGYGMEVLAGNGRLDEAGRLAVSVPLGRFIPEVHELPGRQPDGQPTIPLPTPGYRLDAEFQVADGTGRQERSVASVEVLPGDFAVRCWADDTWLGKHDPVELTVEVTGPEGKPVAGQELELLSFRRYWKPDAAVQRDGRWHWVYPTVPDGPFVSRRPPVGPGYSSRPRQIVRRGDDDALTTGADGTATVTVLPPQPGEWVYVAVARDSGGRQLIDSTDCWVSDQHGSVPGYEPAESLDLRLESPRYRSGETAVARATTPLDGGFVLFTHEGRYLSEAQVVAAAGRTADARFAVGDADVPNGTIAAATVRDKELHQAQRDLPCDLRAKLIDVTVSASRPHARPREVVAFRIDCRHEGMPVDAEVSLAVVDESIFAMREEQPQRAVTAFWGWNYNHVITFFSATPYYYTAGKDEGGEIRRHFPDTALWEPNLLTGADGSVTVELPLPDNLGRWRATAIAHARDTSIGFGRAQVLVNLPLMVRLETPRFLTGGDTVQITAAVHNESGERREVAVGLDAPNLALREAADQRVTLESGARANLTWLADAPRAHDVVARVTAVSGDLRDAHERTIPLQPKAVWQRLVRHGKLSAGEPLVEELLIPDGTALEKTILRIHVAPTVAGSVLQAVDGLIGYPYGCVEQTTSRLLGVLAAQRAWRELGWRPASEADRRRADEAVQRGILRLRRMQHRDGSWGWWETSRSDDWMSAYALDGLLTAREQGHEVPGAVIESGLDALAERLAGHRPGLRRWSIDETFVLLALARGGRPVSPPVWEALFRSKSPQVRAEQSARLALAARAARRPADARRAEAQCLRRLNKQPRSRSGVGGLAWALRALVAAEGASPRVMALVDELNLRFDGHGWRTTRETAVAVAALCEALSRSGDELAEGRLEVAVNGTPLSEYLFNRETHRGPGASYTVAAELLRPGPNRVELGFVGRGALRYLIGARMPVVSEVELPAQSSGGLTLRREYQRVSRAPAGFLYRELGGTVARDTVLRVTLTLESERHEQYLVIEDPLPAGCEVMEPNEVRSRSGDSAQDSDQPGWWGGWCERDVRDDRIAFFYDEVQADHPYTVRYLLRAAHPGRYTALAPRAEPMYEPERYATGEPAVLVIR